MVNRPDFSKYLVHFTKDRRPDSESITNPAKDIKGKSARDRLLSILNERKIIASRLTTGNNANAACFTECVWCSLLLHAKRYSCYGIGFTKEFLYHKGGNPVFYANPNIFNRLIKTQDKPFVALYKPFMDHPVDFSHEREWRVSQSLKFRYSDISFIILKSQTDLADFNDYIQKIVIDKVIIMDEYKKIETFWPVPKVYTQK